MLLQIFTSLSALWKRFKYILWHIVELYIFLQSFERISWFQKEKKKDNPTVLVRQLSKRILFYE